MTHSYCIILVITSLAVTSFW